MYFTQEDYRKIEKWLLANSKKDTQFVEAATPLQGNETIAFVQNGKNVKTSVKDIVDQFFLLGVSDFLNITDKYGEKNITINQAIQLIPFRSRKIGQVITFIDEYGNWAIYQFQGKALNQWNNTTLWINILGSIKNMNNRMAFPLYTNSTYTDDTSEEGVIGTIALSDYPYNYSELQVFYTIPGYTGIFYSTYFNPIRNEVDGTNSDIMCSVMDTKSDDSLMLKQLHATLSNNNKNIVIDYNRIITHTLPTSGTPTATRQIAATGAISGVGYIKIVKVLGLVANNVIANS